MLTRLKRTLKRRAKSAAVRTVLLIVSHPGLRRQLIGFLSIGSWHAKAVAKLAGVVPEKDPAYRLITIMRTAAIGRSLLESHRFARILGDRKKISFIFPYYQKRDVVADAIESLKHQNWTRLTPQDVEIIVVEDGSLDALDTILDDDVIYVRRNKFGYGISRCRNLGAKISNGEILCFVDPDFVFPPDYVENAVAEIERYGSRTVITGYIYDYFYEGCDDPRTAYGVWERPDRPTTRFLNLAGGHMAITRDLFFEAGGFDEDLIYGGVEDLHFGFRLSKMPGTRIVFSTKVATRHRPHPVGAAHAEPHKSFCVAAYKDAEFFQTYQMDFIR